MRLVRTRNWILNVIELEFRTLARTLSANTALTFAFEWLCGVLQMSSFTVSLEI